MTWHETRGLMLVDRWRFSRRQTAEALPLLLIAFALPQGQHPCTLCAAAWWGVQGGAATPPDVFRERSRQQRRKNSTVDETIDMRLSSALGCYSAVQTLPVTARCRRKTLLRNAQKSSG